jgi:hypothetical protein
MAKPVLIPTSTFCRVALSRFGGVAFCAKTLGLDSATHGLLPVKVEFEKTRKRIEIKKKQKNFQAHPFLP